MVMRKMPIIFSQMPAFAICGMRIRPEPNTIAFGGVATGNIKAQLAAMVAGIIIVIGAIPSPTAIAANIGTRAVVVATLLVSSVRKIMKVTPVASSLFKSSKFSLQKASQKLIKNEKI